MAERKGNFHAIMVVFPYQGHVNPSTNLALKFASKGFVVTFVLTDFIHHQITKSHYEDSGVHVDIFADARKSGLDIRYTTISDGFPMEFDRLLNMEEHWDCLLRDFPARVDELVAKIIESDTSLVPFLVADSFFSWPARIAKKYNLVNVSFWTQPALVFSIAYHAELLKENDHFPPSENSKDLINYIPGVESISAKDLMSFCVDPNARTIIEYQVVFGAFEEVKKADFILHNTVYELESESILSLDQKQPTYAVGPTNFYINSCTKSTSVANSMFPPSDCTEWLNSKPPGSVLYISFGSLAESYKQATQEIAQGLLLSQVNFIWIVRDDINAAALPIEYKSVIGDKGLMIPWCNQKEVLSNPAIGGFITHCGWNSILESIWFSVPMLCHPFLYDQPTNRKLVVDDWKIGINLCDGISVTREEVACNIKRFMSEDMLCGFRQAIKKISKILHDAVKTDGSSEKYMDKFIKDLKAKIHA